MNVLDSFQHSGDSPTKEGITCNNGFEDITANTPERPLPISRDESRLSPSTPEPISRCGSTNHNLSRRNLHHRNADALSQSVKCNDYQAIETTTPFLEPSTETGEVNPHHPQYPTTSLTQEIANRNVDAAILANVMKGRKGQGRRNTFRHEPGISPTTCALRVANNLPEGRYECAKLQYSPAKGEYRVRFILNGYRRERSFATKLRGHTYAQAAATELLRLLKLKCVSPEVSLLSHGYYETPQHSSLTKGRLLAELSDASLNGSEGSSQTPIHGQERLNRSLSSELRQVSRSKIMKEGLCFPQCSGSRRNTIAVSPNKRRYSGRIVEDLSGRKSKRSKYPPSGEKICTNCTSDSFPPSKTDVACGRSQKKLKTTELGHKVPETKRCHVSSSPLDGVEEPVSTIEDVNSQTVTIVCQGPIHRLHELRTSSEIPSSNYNPFERRREFIDDPVKNGYHYGRVPQLTTKEKEVLRNAIRHFPIPCCPSKTSSLVRLNKDRPCWIIRTHYVDWQRSGNVLSREHHVPITDVSEETLTETLNASLSYALMSREYTSVTNEYLRREGGWAWVPYNHRRAKKSLKEIATSPASERKKRVLPQPEE